MDPKLLTVGTEVNVSYTGYHIRATVVEAPDAFGWVEVEQITDYEGEDRRPRFKAYIEFVTLPGEPLARGPFEAMFAMIASKR